MAENDVTLSEEELAEIKAKVQSHVKSLNKAGMADAPGEDILAQDALKILGFRGSDVSDQAEAWLCGADNVCGVDNA